MTRRLLYPNPLSGNLPLAAVGTDLEPVYQFGTALPTGHLIPLLFDVPVRLIVIINSVIGDQNNWIRAGHLAQLLYGVPGNPKKAVERLYLDEAFFEFDGAGYPFYFEFWAYRWITDYYLELWAEQIPTLVTVPAQAFTIGGEAFTIDGVRLDL